MVYSGHMLFHCYLRSYLKMKITFPVSVAGRAVGGCLGAVLCVRGCCRCSYDDPVSSGGRGSRWLVQIGVADDALRRAETHEAEIEVNVWAPDSADGHARVASHLSGGIGCIWDGC